MAEHRSSISSNGPSFLSVSLQQQLNELGESPPLQSVRTYSKETNKDHVTTISSDLTYPILIKSSSSSRAVGTSNSTNLSPTFGNESKQPVTVTSTSPSLSSSLYVAANDDDVTRNSENITIDMIQTLPLFDAAAYSTNGDPHSNSLRCYISNMIMPNCKSSCSIPSSDISSLPKVLHNINDFLRIQCITYKIQYTSTTVAFHCERNSAFASLVGPTLVFVIYLWYEQPSTQSGDDSVPNASGTSSSSKPILIDVQRRSGCPLDLQCIRRSLFRSLLKTDGSKTEEVGLREGMIPLDLCRKIWSKYNGSTSKDNKDDATTVSHEDSEKEIEATSEAMEQVRNYQDMLALTNTVEKHRMALECLCQHTDSTATDIAKSKSIVHIIVCSRTPDETFRQVATGSDQFDAVAIEKFRTGLLHFLTTTDTPEVTQVLSTAGCAPKNLQCLALRSVYTSVLLFISTNEATKETLLSIENDPFWSTTIETCRKAIDIANTSPCFATVSMLLMYALLTSKIVSVPSKQMIYDILCPNNDSSRICNELKTAHAWGKQHHRHLEDGSKQLLDFLQESTSKNGVRL